MQKKILSTIQIDILQLEENLTQEYSEYVLDCGTASKLTYKQFKSGYFPDYDSEKSYIHRKEPRIEWIANLLQEKAALTGNVLCLVDSISLGRRIAEKIPGAIFVNGQDVKDPNKRKAIYDLFKTRDDLIVIATVHIVGTGLSINRIFNLVSVDIGKSFIRVIQGIGRGLRRFEDKTHVTYTDICSDLKYGQKHLTHRLSFYKEAKYPHTKQIVDYDYKKDLIC
jgi:superfamily II DNA or RNA helicase